MAMLLGYLWDVGEAAAIDMYKGSGLNKTMIDDLLPDCIGTGLLQYYVKDEGHRARVFSLTQKGCTTYILLATCRSVAPIGFVNAPESGSVDLDDEVLSALDVLRRKFIGTEYVNPSEGKVVTLETRGVLRSSPRYLFQ